MALVLFLIVYWLVIFFVIDNWIFKAAGVGIGFLIPGGGEVLGFMVFVFFLYKCYQTAGSIIKREKTS